MKQCGETSEGEDKWTPPKKINLNPFTKRELRLIQDASATYGIPWQVTAAILAAEVNNDTSLRDTIENIVVSLFPAETYSRPNGAGPGKGNVHIPTARGVAQYFADGYSENEEMQFVWAPDPDWAIASALVFDGYNIPVVAAYVRQLADYRFGSNGDPLQTDHSDISAWSSTDVLALWHGYRYGVKGVSPSAEGWKNVRDFQNRGPFVYAPGGTDAAMNIAGAVPFVSFWFGQR